MSLRRLTHRRIALLTLHPVALCLAVVLWGAGYKMEQYPEQGLAFRVMSPAKLLTEKERPVQKGSLRAVLVLASQKRGSGSSHACGARDSGPRAFSPPGKKRLAAFPRMGWGSPRFSYFSSRPPPSVRLRS